MLLLKGNLNRIFSFLPSYVNNILDNVSPELLLKLYQCCKYFCFKTKVTVARNVKFENLPDEKNVKFAFGIIYRSYNYNGNKLWLTDKLTVSSFETPSLICGPIGNYFLNKIYRNNLKELDIYGGYILFKELRVLSKSPNLIKFGYHAAIKNDDGHSTALFEDIMVFFPNIKYLKTNSPYFTKETFKKLLKFKFQNKIKELKFWDIQSEFDPISLCDFLKENFDVNAVFDLSFGRNFQLKNQLLPQVKALINSWEKIKLKRESVRTLNQSGTKFFPQRFCNYQSIKKGLFLSSLIDVKLIFTSKGNENDISKVNTCFEKFQNMKFLQNILFHI